MILDDDASSPPVVGLAVVSDNQRNRLQWQNPDWTTTPVGIVVRYNAASGGCTPPATPTDGSGFSFPPGVAGQARLATDPNVPLTNGWEYCYTVFVDYGGGPTGFSSGVAVKATPFLPGKVKWKYFTGTGATTVAPPTVGQDAALVPSNDNFVHGMTRGAAGGTWPTNLEAGRPRLAGADPVADRSLRRWLALLPQHAGRLGPRDRRQDRREDLGDADRIPRPERPPLASSSPTAAAGTTSSWGRARPRTTASTPSTRATGR